jgi:hypothetical protein
MTHGGEFMLGLISSTSAGTILGIIGILAIIVNIITEVLKSIVPANFPTKALVLIVSFVVTLLFVLIFCIISFQTIALGIVGSFIVAFISMYGWDTLKEIIVKFKYPL